MKFIAFIERKEQADVIETILKHFNIWIEPGSRDPPCFANVLSDRSDTDVAIENIEFVLEPEIVPFDEFLTCIP